MSEENQTTANLERAVVLNARAFTRCVAEFPDDPAAWSEWLDALGASVTRLDQHLGLEWKGKM